MTLFWKIFAWFWGAMVAVGGALFVAVTATQPDPLPAAWREATGHSLGVYGSEAADAWEKGGAAALSVSLRRLRRQTHAQLWLYDTQGRSLAPQPTFNAPSQNPPADAPPAAAPHSNDAPPRDDARGERGSPREFGPGRGPMPPEARAQVAALARTTLQEGGDAARFVLWGPLVRVAQSVQGKSGRRYALAGEMRRPREGRAPIEAGALLLRVCAVLLPGTLLCYGLARYLSAPLFALRAATHRLAAGDLDARTGLGRKGRDELAGLGRDFDAMAERLQTLMMSERRLLEAQRRLMGDVSHELRSPLTRLGVALALARHFAAATPRPELDAAHERIAGESARLNELIGQVLQLTRLESGIEGGRASQEVDFAGVVKSVAEDARFEAGQHHRGVELLRCDPCRLRGDESLLRSAVDNVVRNAIRHTREGTQVEISLQVAAHEAVFSVRDGGEGVPEAALSELFKPFYRVESARDRDSGGVGLGLAITERAISTHGGSVRARNAESGGLIVEMRLPLRPIVA